MSVEQLPSARLRDAQANLAAFIAKGKSSTAFGPVDWDAPIWRDPIVKQRPASEGPQRNAFYFLTGQGGRRGSDIQAPMKQPFADFVKAAIRLHDDTSRKVWTRHAHTILVCRYLHDELAEVGYDPCRALPRHFTAAAKAISAKSTEKSAYHGGACLARVASWIDKAGIGRVRLGWKNPIAATSHNDRITVEAASARESKMPSPAALAALPEISRQLSDPSKRPASTLWIRG